MKKTVCITSLIMLLCYACTGYKGTTMPANEKQTAKWYAKKAWLGGGLQLKPHSSTNVQELARQYWARKSWWDTAFSFLKSHNLTTIANGKYQLLGDTVYVAVTEGPLKELDKTAWEAHRRYIDLQYISRGKEKIGVAPVSTATVINPYNETKDVANFQTDGRFYVSDPGTFFLFFSQDAHRPSINVDGQPEKKVVVKIMAAE